MNKNQDVSSRTIRAHPGRSLPIPRIVKPQPAAPATDTAAHAMDPTRPLKPANVMKAVRVQKHAPWLTTAKIPSTSKIP